MPDIFDQVASEMNIEPSTTVQGQGDIFDQVASELKQKPILASSTPEATVSQWGIDNPNLYAAWETAKGTLKETGKGLVQSIPYAGMAVGGITAGVPGAAVLYGAGKDIERKIIGEDEKASLKNRLLRSAKDVGEGAMWEMGGRVAPEIISGAVKGIGKVTKPLLGRMGGTYNAVEEAIKTGKEAPSTWNPFKSKSDFDKAMRGDFTKEEIVENSHKAFQSIKQDMSKAYVDKLKRIQTDPKALDSVKQNLDTEIIKAAAQNEFNIGISAPNQSGKITLDFSQSPLVKDRKIIKKAIEDVFGWSDRSAAGLDNLQKRLGTYISQTKRDTPQRAFLTRLKSNLSEGLKNTVPEYKEMTQGYAEVKNLLKDIEADLMLRPEGMSGRITADKTLRRLMSAMKDNFEVRQQLLEVLGNKGKQKLTEQIAGYTMQPTLPRGLSGSVPSLIGETALSIINPKFLPVFLASSPRFQGEFLRLFGQFMKQSRTMAPAVSRSAIASKEFDETQE